MYQKKAFQIILVLTIIGEFLVPFILKQFYPSYDSKKMAMSVLGNKECPVYFLYKIWLIWLGLFIVITGIAYFNEIKKSSISIAVMELICICTFAIGAGLLSGIFSVNETKEVVTFSSIVHGISAPIGFMLLLFLPLLETIVMYKQNKNVFGTIDLVAFILAFASFVCFIMGDKEQFTGTIIAYEGLWERVSLFFMYVPFIIRAVPIIVNIEKNSL